jgi:hypothetical protein
LEPWIDRKIGNKIGEKPLLSRRQFSLARATEISGKQPELEREAAVNSSFPSGPLGGFSSRFSPHFV